MKKMINDKNVQKFQVNIRYSTAVIITAVIRRYYDTQYVSYIILLQPNLEKLI